LLVGARCAPYNELLAEAPQLKVRPQAVWARRFSWNNQNLSFFQGAMAGLAGTAG
jgi:hypothetical protein